jgi:hypothetical protein
MGKDFQKFCWSKWKIFRASSFLVTLCNRKCYAIAFSVDKKSFWGGGQNRAFCASMYVYGGRRTTGSWRRQKPDTENQMGITWIHGLHGLTAMIL